jgi:elongation factor 1-gamma
MAAAAINGLEVEIPAGFEMGKTNKTAEYLAKFPLGKIPSFESSTGYYLTESNAITYYLCDSGPKKNQLLGATPEEHALVHQWVFFTSEQLHKTVMALVYPVLGFVQHDAKLEAEKTEELHCWMKYIEAQLEGRTWLLPGDRDGPSLADLSVAQGFRMGFLFSVDTEFRNGYPKIMDWWNRLLSIPEVEKNFAANTLLEKKVSTKQ